MSNGATWPMRSPRSLSLSGAFSDKRVRIDYLKLVVTEFNVPQAMLPEKLPPDANRWHWMQRHA
jgi:hypothetical protein